VTITVSGASAAAVAAVQAAGGTITLLNPPAETPAPAEA
jgi:large subunit ribosomal protein L15